MTTASTSERRQSFADCAVWQVGDVQAFFARAYHDRYRLAADEALFRWQFAGPSPSSSTYHVRLATRDDAILGTLGYLPVDLTVAGRTVHAAWGANWMVDPSQRRLGVGPLLMRDVMQNFDAVLCVGLSQDAQDVLARMAWADVGALHRWVAVLDAQSAGRLTESGRYDGTPPAVVAPPAIDRAVQRIERFGEDVSTLWDAFAADRIAGTRRTAAYLNWRYAHHPTFRYHLFEERRDGRMTGLAIYRVETVAGLATRVGRMLELISERDPRALIQAMLHDAAAQGVVMMDFFCATTRWSAALHECGFLAGDDPAVADLPILFQPIDRRRRTIQFMASLRNLPAASSLEWYVTKGDGDQDRPN